MRNSHEFSKVIISKFRFGSKELRAQSKTRDAMMQYFVRPSNLLFLPLSFQLRFESAGSFKVFDTPGPFPEV